MIAIAPSARGLVDPQKVANAFEQMLPTIERVAAFGFRHVPRWRRQELIADVVSTAYVAFLRLVERGKAALAYPTVLAKYAIRRVRCGRCLGTKQNVRDALSPLAQRRQGFSVELLSQ